MSDGKVVIDTELDSKGAVQGANKLGSALKKGLGTAVKAGAVGIASFGTAVIATSASIVKSAKGTADYGDRVDKMSQKIGMSRKAFQEWDFILQQNGTDISTLQVGMKTLSTQASKNSDSFKKLGISQQDLKKLSPEQLFEKTVKQLQKMPESTERTALASKLLGRSAVELKPLLNSTAESTKELKKQANEYGMVMSDKAVKASATFEDSLNKMKQSAKGAKNTMLSTLLPSMTKVTDGMAKLFKGDTSGINDIVKGIEDVSNQIQKKIPIIVKEGGKIVTAIAKGIVSNLPIVAYSIAKSAPQIIGSLKKILPTIFNQVKAMVVSGVKMIFGTDTANTVKDLLNGISEEIPKAFAQVKIIFNQLVTAIRPFLDIALQLASYILPALTSVLGFVATNFETLKKIVVAVGIAFVTLKVVSIISTIMATLPAIISAVTSAFEIMKVALATHPLFALVTVISSVALAFEMFGDDVDGSVPSMEKFGKATGDLNGIIEEQKAKVDELTDSYFSLQEQSAKRVDDINAEITQSQSQWEELKKIVEENGNIKKGYEDRAKYLTGELSSALGVEFEWDKKKIKNMNTINGKIEKQIEMTRLKNIVEAKTAEYNEAKKNEVELASTLAEQKQTLTKAEENYSKTQEQHNKNLKEYKKQLDDGTISQEEYDEKLHTSIRTLGDSSEAVRIAREAVENTTEAYEEGQATISNYENATKAIGTSTKKMAKASEDLSTNVKKAGRDSNEAVKKQADTAVKNYKKIKDAYDNHVSGISKKQVDAAKEQASTALKEYGKVGENTAKGYISGLENETGAMSDAVRKFVRKAIEEGNKEAQIHSPSMLTTQSGRYLAQGWYKGFEKENPSKRIATSVKYGMNTIQKAMNSDFSNNLRSNIEIGMSNIGEEMVNALQKAGLKVQIGDREFGRVVRRVI